MAWIELHQSLFTHRKTIEAALLLELPEVYIVGHLTALWTWALDNAPEGLLRTADAVIERVCQWPGERGALLAALVQAGFLERQPESSGYAIHDWHAYAGRLMEQRKRNADRMQTARKAAKEPKEEPEEEAREKQEERAERAEREDAPHVHCTCGARAPATVPYPTVPYQTQPERENTPALRTLYEAFRALRHPDSPSQLFGSAEWDRALPWLTKLLEVGATPETLTQATQAALTRWKHAGQVTVKAIAEHWTELLEPEPVARERAQGATVRAAPMTALDRRAAEWEVYTQRELERQLAAYDDWATTTLPKGALQPLAAAGGRG